MTESGGTKTTIHARWRNLGTVLGAAVLCGAVLLGVWGVWVVSQAWGAAVEPRLEHLPRSERVNAETRAEVRARMGRHGNTMSQLVRAVVLLDRPTIRNLAGRIADEEIIAPGGTGNGGGGRLALPDAFYLEQSRLSVIAQNMALAAREGKDDLVMADHFSGLARTCVACHSAYVRSGPFPLPTAPRSAPPRRN